MQIHDEGLLKRQKADWPRMRQMAREGNSLATLCYHCFGRHAPPHTEICPFDPPGQKQAADAR
jgi:Fe-S-cluster-containing hydrogenase component 2